MPPKDTINHTSDTPEVPVQAAHQSTQQDTDHPTVSSTNHHPLKKPNWLDKYRHSPKALAVVFIALFAVIGTITLLISHAATNVVSLKPSADIATSNVSGVAGGTTSSSNLWQDVDDGVTFASSDNDTTRVQTASGVASGSHTAGYSGAPTGTVTQVVSNVRAHTSTKFANGTIQVLLYDGTNLIGTGSVHSLSTSYANFSDTFASLNVANGNNLRTEVKLKNTASRGNVIYTQIWLDATYQATQTTPQAPTVSTTPATSITATAATLNGTTNPNGAATTCHFDYGTTTSYGTSTANDTSPGSGNSQVNVTANLTGLTSSTTYHYRLSCTNSVGTSNGADQSFTTTTTTTTTTYNSTILADAPVAFWDMKNPTSTEPDLTGNGHTGTYKGGIPTLTSMLNSDQAVDFNGSNQYMTVPSSASFSIPTTKQLTWEAWIRPDVLQFSTATSDPHNYGYIDWMGKCENYSPTCEWESRMYSSVNSQNRCNRLSAYVFNSSAGLGSGADWQPTCNLLQAGQWLHVVGEYQTLTTPSGCNTAYPGSIDIWVNGIKWDMASHTPTGCMSQYSITPTASSSPLNIGTMGLDTWFPGAVGKVAIYNKLLSQTQISNHFTAMTGAQPSGSCASTCTIPVPTP